MKRQNSRNSSYFRIFFFFLIHPKRHQIKSKRIKRVKLQFYIIAFKYEIWKKKMYFYESV